jgi:undecaprenyl-diphosphatase
MVKGVKRGAKRIFATIALLSLELVVVLVSFFVAMGLFIAMAKMIFLEKRQDFDTMVSNFMRANVTDFNTDVMQFFSFLGTHYFLIPANLAFFCYFLFIRKHRWYSIKMPVVSASSTVLLFLLKFIFQRERPLDPLLQAARGLSFPSGHAMMSFTFYGLLAYMIWTNMHNRLLKIVLVTVLLLVILFIGVSRVYLNVHYASDVIAGFCLGLMWLVLCSFAIDKIEKYSRKEINPVVQSDT